MQEKKEIVLSDISKKYGEHWVFQNFSLRLPAGETICIRGRSGHGKTTLLHMLARLIAPDAGTIDGIPDRIAFVFQENRLCEEFSPLANIRLVTGKSLSEEEILHHLQELGLEQWARKPVKVLSGGMKRRVAIARAICYQADLLLLDEAFQGLDAETKQRTMDYVKHHSAGKTVLYATHIPEEVAYMGGQIINLDCE